jgi:hypothetical protein
MQGLDPIDGDGDDGTVFRDVIMLALLGFVTIVILLLPHLNPPTKQDAAADPPGNVVVEIRWPDKDDADIDLWVQAPGDAPVGYSNKDGGVFNLLRDDLGHIQDLSSLNYEMAYSRGTPQGEYTVNLHLYRSRTTPLPIPVEVNIGIRKSNSESLVTVASNRVQLFHEGEELTVVRFRLSQLGRLVKGSVHDLPRILRNPGG